jgi:DNA-binding HxlR family transcriptional regulator
LIKEESKADGRSQNRAGTRALSLLAAPVNTVLLQEVVDGPRPLTELSWAAGAPSPSTLRTRLRELIDLEVLTPKRQEAFPRSLEYELTKPGRDLLGVAEVLIRWLAECPEGELAWGSPQAKLAVKALSQGWSLTMVRALAARPFSLTQLNRLIAGLSYPSLERRLGAMRCCGQVAPVDSSGPGTPYTVTDWLRRAAAPLLTAAQWERLYAPLETAPIGRIDVEAIFLLTVPLLKLPDDLSGGCRLVFDLATGSDQRLAGVVVEVEEGSIVSCKTVLEGEAEAWATGTPSGWLDAIVRNDHQGLELVGDSILAAALVDGLHETLFAQVPS